MASRLSEDKNVTVAVLESGPYADDKFVVYAPGMYVLNAVIDQDLFIYMYMFVCLLIGMAKLLALISVLFFLLCLNPV